MTKKIYKANTKLSEIITKEQIEQWIDNKDNVIFDCPTGTGKTYWSLNDLASHITKDCNMLSILYLCNRFALKQEVIDKANSLPNVKVMTYQMLEQNYINSEVDLSIYDVIICDECHYFFQDSSFNYNNDLSYKVVMNTNVTKIFMSATGNTLFSYLITTKQVKEDNYIFIERDYSYINDIIFYKRTTKMHYDELKILQLLQQTEDKIIYFVSKTEIGLELYKKLEKTYKVAFRCGTSAKGEAQEINKKYQDIIKDGKLQCRLLITTSALDNGVNIIDEEVKHVFISSPSIVTLIQELGRARKVDDNYKLNVYIEDLNKYRLSNFIKTNDKEYNKVMLFKQDEKKYYSTYGKDNTDGHYIYLDPKTKEIVFNLVGFILLSDNHMYYEAMQKGKKSYIKFVLEGLYMPKFKYIYDDGKYLLSEDENIKQEMKSNLQKYISKNKGKDLKSKQQETLKNLCNEKTTQGIRKYLKEELGINLKAKQKSIKGKKVTVWYFEELEIE